MHVSLRLLERGSTVIGIDDLNPYYDVRLKQARLARLQASANFRFRHMSIADRDAVAEPFAQKRPQRVVHLAAQPGVRPFAHPPACVRGCEPPGVHDRAGWSRHHAVEHLVYASSSSVYGGNNALPLSERHNVDHAVSLYAATKKANELMAHTYSHLFRLPTTGLRFFTV